MKIMSALLSSALLVAAPATAQQTAPRADQLAFRDLYKELVETDTTLSAGSCTLAAERMAARLKTAGFGDDQLTLFADPDHPKEGGLVAVYPGTSPSRSCSSRISTLSRRNVPTGSATRSRWSRKTAISMAAERSTTRRRRRSGPTR